MARTRRDPPLIRAKGRRKPCGAEEARARLAKARQFLTLATAGQEDETVRSAEASLLIEAGIAAADAICCVRLGERPADQNHQAAVDLLASVHRDAARRLQTLLGLKTSVQYGTGDPSAARLRAARRAASALMDVARQAVSET
ncbi:MAG TPA: hypothetical protein VE575_14325 [Acidimicrobiales bacterium]|nr:hypothetical protein [Acidimicrobiales bacterium]